MATSKAKKTQVMEQVREILQSNADLILTEYRGLDVEKMTELRATLRKAGVKYKILKNTLLKKLVSESALGNLDPYLAGPIGVAFLGAEVTAAAKALTAFAKKNEMLVIKAGYIEGRVLGFDGIQAVATLPSREVMLAVLLGTFQAPLRAFLTVAQGNTRKLAYALNALKQKKEKAAA